MTINEALLYLKKNLQKMYSNEEAQQHAYSLLSWITHTPVTQLLTHPQKLVSSTQIDLLQQAIKDHIEEHKPLQYIFGTVPFLDLSITVKPPILIPRSETEYWCKWLIDTLQPLSNYPLNILDICTGTGAIGLSLAKAFPQSHVMLVDISQLACTLAQENARNNSIHNVSIIQSDLFSAFTRTSQTISERSLHRIETDLYQPIEKNSHQLISKTTEHSLQKFDLIVSNPPYISPEEFTSLERSVAQWEDPQALIAQEQGLSIIKKLIEQAPQWLKHNEHFAENNLPNLVLEIGHTQGKAVAELLHKNKYKNIQIYQDLAQKDRFVSAYYNNLNTGNYKV